MTYFVLNLSDMTVLVRGWMTWFISIYDSFVAIVAIEGGAQNSKSVGQLEHKRTIFIFACILLYIFNMIIMYFLLMQRCIYKKRNYIPFSSSYIQVLIFHHVLFWDIEPWLNLKNLLISVIYLSFYTISLILYDSRYRHNMALPKAAILVGLANYRKSER